MHEKLSSPAGRETYAKRKAIAEPVFGHIKAALGFRRFSLRGLAKVRAEWAIACTCHNLLKLFRALGPLPLAALGWHAAAAPPTRATTSAGWVGGP